MNPKISVIVPVFNVKPYLEDCLSSIQAQQENDFDVWMIDDGSTDGSALILQDWQKRDSRFHLITQKNAGLSAARNTGLDQCKGDYVAFIDSDDIVSPEYLKELSMAASGSHSPISVCDMDYFDETGKHQFSSGGDFDVLSLEDGPSLLGINNSACNKLFARNLFSNIRFPEGKYYEDLATVPILLYKAGKAVKVNKALYYYRQRQGSIAHKANPKIFEIYDAIDGVISYLKINGVADGDPLLEEVRHLYVIHGLDLTTLRIKDFTDKKIRAEYLKENMKRLCRSYPDYKMDTAYRNAAIKKKLIWKLLDSHQEAMVLRLYDR